MASQYGSRSSRSTCTSITRNATAPERLQAPSRSGIAPRPRTAFTSTSGKDNEIVCAISESRGISPIVGLSFVNLSTSEAVLCQFADTQTYVRTCHKIKVFNPTEVIYMSTAEGSKLVSIVQGNIDDDNASCVVMTNVDRRYWAESTGYDYIRQLAFPEDLDSLKVSIGGNYFAACCFAAVGPREDDRKHH